MAVGMISIGRRGRRRSRRFLFSWSLLFSLIYLAIVSEVLGDLRCCAYAQIPVIYRLCYFSSQISKTRAI